MRRPASALVDDALYTLQLYWRAWRLDWFHRRRRRALVAGLGPLSDRWLAEHVHGAGRQG